MKYDPLRRYLEGEPGPVVELTFQDVETIIGGALPRSARTHPAWWSNNATGHVNAVAWLRAGFKAERIDLAQEKLSFRRTPRIAAADGFEDGSAPFASGRSKGFLTRIRAEMAGTVTIPDGVDICAPTGEVWDAER